MPNNNWRPRSQVYFRSCVSSTMAYGVPATGGALNPPRRPESSEKKGAFHTRTASTPERTGPSLKTCGGSECRAHTGEGGNFKDPATTEPFQYSSYASSTYGIRSATLG